MVLLFVLFAFNLSSHYVGYDTTSYQDRPYHGAPQGCGSVQHKFMLVHVKGGIDIQGVSGGEVINYRAGRGLADKYFSHRNLCPEMYSNGDSAPGG